MLDVTYYPMSAIQWFWHKIFGSALGSDNASPGRWQTCMRTCRRGSAEWWMCRQYEVTAGGRVGHVVDVEHRTFVAEVRGDRAS